LNTTRPAVGAIFRPFEQPAILHAFEQGSDRIRVTGDHVGDLPLSEACGIRLDERPQDGELVRRNSEV
jgi:hypothetical protein